MVDFKKWLAKRDVWKLIDPVAIYETLDRASDKGPLRPPPRQRSFGPGTSSAETRSAGLSQNATVGVTNPGNGGAQSQGSLK